MSMDIALVRVDNRLVHGQIIEAWVPYIKAACIYVVDDDVASDFFRETVIKMAVPHEVDVIVHSIEVFAGMVPFKQGSGKKVIVLFSNITDALRAHNLGFKFNKLNVGNVYNEDCYRQLSTCVLLSDQDMDSIRKLLQLNVLVELRRVPREKPTDIRALPDALKP
jgi:mannose/fructose/N-acetylgalactosamine-specific phosphotransferase system component IIB